MLNSSLAQSTQQFARGLQNAKLIVPLVGLLLVVSTRTPTRTPSGSLTETDFFVIFSVMALVGVILAYFLLTWIQGWVEQIAWRESGNSFDASKLEKTHSTLSKWLTAFKVFTVLGFLGGLSSFNAPNIPENGSLASLFGYLSQTILILDFFLILYIANWSKAAFKSKQYSNHSKKIVNIMLLTIILNVLYSFIAVLNAFSRELSTPQLIGILLTNLLSVYFVFVQVWGRNWIISLSTQDKSNSSQIINPAQV